MPAAVVPVMKPTPPATTATTVVVVGMGEQHVVRCRARWQGRRDRRPCPWPQPPGWCAVRIAAGRRSCVLMLIFGVTCRVYGQSHGYNHPPRKGRGTRR